MSTADAAMTPSEVASHAARVRWVEREGSPVVVRSALTVLERADELPQSLREQVHQATGREDPDD